MPVPQLQLMSPVREEGLGYGHPEQVEVLREVELRHRLAYEVVRAVSIDLLDRGIRSADDPFEVGGDDGVGALLEDRELFERGAYQLRPFQPRRHQTEQP